MSHYSHYRGRSIGRIIHFIYSYCGYSIGSTCTVGEKIVFHERGNALKHLADVKWSEHFGEGDVPEFTFYGSDAEYFQQQQILNRSKAIEESLERAAAESMIECVPGPVVQVLNEKAFRSAHWMASGFEKKEQFYICTPAVNHAVQKKEFRVEIPNFGSGRRIYSWNDECGWLLMGKY
jgi:hypothetical protein